MKATTCDARPVAAPQPRALVVADGNGGTWVVAGRGPPLLAASEPWRLVWSLLRRGPGRCQRHMRGLGAPPSIGIDEGLASS